MGSGGKTRWKISFHRSSSRPQKKPPQEFICPISTTLMADPVIVSSGQTFERSCAQACLELSFIPILSDGSRPDLSSLIPNLALKSAILHWCDLNGSPRPTPTPLDVARNLVCSFIGAEKGEETEKGDKGGEEEREEITQKEGRGGEEEVGGKTPKREVQMAEKEMLLRGVSANPHAKFSYAATEVNRRPKHFYSSSEESLVTTPLPLATKPLCYSASSSSSSSSEIVASDDTEGTPNSSQDEEVEILTKLKSTQIFEQEEALVWLRDVSRNHPEKRIPLCNQTWLSALRPLLTSRYPNVQINAVAAMVNLSLEKPNKVKIVRSGAVPPLIDVLKSGSMEAQEHAAGAIFSLALDDDNKTAIGVLGALPPLLHMLRSESERGRQDAALALYHLTLVQSNRSKLVKLGSIPVLLSFTRVKELASRVLIILYNLASGSEGRVAVLDADGVEVFVDILREKNLDGAVRDHCIAALFALSQSHLRFKGSAKAAGAVEVLKEVAEGASERARQQVKRMLILLKENEGIGAVTEEEHGIADDDGERVSDSFVGAVRHQQRYQLHRGKNASGANSTEF